MEKHHTHFYIARNECCAAAPSVGGSVSGLNTPAAAFLEEVPIAQLVSALDFNFERAVEGSILTAGKRLSLKNLNVIIRAIN